MVDQLSKKWLRETTKRRIQVYRIRICFNKRTWGSLQRGYSDYQSIRTSDSNMLAEDMGHPHFTMPIEIGTCCVLVTGYYKLQRVWLSFFTSQRLLFDGLSNRKDLCRLGFPYRCCSLLAQCSQEDLVEFEQISKNNTIPREYEKFAISAKTPFYNDHEYFASRSSSWEQKRGFSDSKCETRTRVVAVVHFRSC